MRARWGAALLDELRTQGIADISDFDQAVAQIVIEAAGCFNRWFGTISPTQRPGVLATIAGYRKRPMMPPEPMICMLNSQTNFAPQLFGHMPFMSGVPQYAVYLVHRYYDPSISVEEALALAEYLIAETASQDRKVGGPIRIAEITQTQGYRELREEVLAIHQRNEVLNQRLRQFFLKGKQL